MSNAMRTGKRWLAGVAAGALTLGMVPLVTVTAAQTANAATLTSSVSPVRVTFAGTALESVPYAAVSWTSSVPLDTNDTVEITLTTAPTATAELSVGDDTWVGTQVLNTSNNITSGDDTLTLTGDKTHVVTTSTNTPDSATASFAVAANTAGTYAGTAIVNADGVPTDTFSFSFTSRGKPTALAITPATQTTAVSGLALLTATLTDAAGAVTQPLFVDSVALTSSPTVASPNANSFLTSGGTALTTANTLPAGWSGSPSAANKAATLYDGVASFGFLNGGTGGVYTVTGTPAGTLASSGVTAQTATVTASGTVNETVVSSIFPTVPVDQANDTLASNPPSGNVQVPAGTTAITVAVVGQSTQAGATVYIRAISTTGGGTPSASAPQIVPVTLGANLRGTASFTLGGSAAAPDSVLTVNQVSAAGSSLTSGITITQKSPTVAAADITPTPGGTIVQKLATSTPVAVTVTDQFLRPVAGAVVRAYRTSTAGALLGTASTNASGVANVTVSPATGLAAGASESYVFTAEPVGVSTPVLASSGLTIVYTAAGETTGLSLSLAGGNTATMPITNTTTTAPNLIPAIFVPSGGSASTNSLGVWSISGDDTTVTVNGNLLNFKATATPGGLVTVTAPEGVKLSAFDLASTNTWNGGASTLTVNSAQSVYVYATKTGVHELTFTSGTISVKAKIKVLNRATDAYNIVLDPATKRVATSTFDRVTLTVTDVFGNPVPNTTAANGLVRLTATGQILLGGLATSTTLTTGADGTATVSFITDNDSGEGVITATPGVLTNAWVASGYVPPTGAPAPIKSAKSVITVSSAQTKSIVIVGERGTVSGKPGIIVDGATTGLDAGAKVKPWVRFPGQTSYAEGTARPTVGAAGDFDWQRKTGKKTYVYFTTEDGAVQSNRVIIPAN